MGLPSYMRSVVDRKFVMRRISVLERFPLGTSPKAPNSPEVFVPFLGFSKKIVGKNLNLRHDLMFIGPCIVLIVE